MGKEKYVRSVPLPSQDLSPRERGGGEREGSEEESRAGEGKRQDEIQCHERSSNSCGVQG